jgi:hypothetical protein
LDGGTGTAAVVSGGGLSVVVLAAGAPGNSAGLLSAAGVAGGAAGCGVSAVELAALPVAGSDCAGVGGVAIPAFGAALSAPAIAPAGSASATADVNSNAREVNATSRSRRRLDIAKPAFARTRPEALALQVYPST